jgi:hypothetical protein
VKFHEVRLRLILTLGLICLLSMLALVIDHRSVFAVNGFSDNQELPLPLVAPIANSGVSFIVRGLEPSVRVDPQGTVYVSSIRGVPTGVDLHRYYAARARERTVTEDVSPHGARVLTKRCWQPSEVPLVTPLMGEFPKHARVVYGDPQPKGGYCVGIQFEGPHSSGTYSSRRVRHRALRNSRQDSDERC